MGFKYTGKPLTPKAAEAFLRRTYLKPKSTYDLINGKFVKRKRKSR